MDANNLRFYSIKELKQIQMDAALIPIPHSPPLFKKQKIEENIPVEQSVSPLVVHLESPRIEILANDFITLVFVETVLHGTLDSDIYRYHYFKPDYTHQLFENEVINFLDSVTQESFIKCHSDYVNDGRSVLKDAKGPKLLIYIRCDDLAHYIVTTSIMQSDQIQLMAHIQPAVPVPSICYCSSDTEPELSEVSISKILFKDTLDLFPKISPPGTLLSRFESPFIASRKGYSFNSSAFELYLATDKDPGASELLSKAERIATWHIETADSVDFADDRWEVLYLYNHNTSSVSIDTNSSSTNDSNSMNTPILNDSNLSEELLIRNFAGYMTLFTFHNPFLGSKIRVCQVLTLPHMQGRGLGREMLLAVYRLAQNRTSVTEVTVEDPCPAFERLRDAVDCEWVLLHIHNQQLKNNSNFTERTENIVITENDLVIMKYKDEISKASSVSADEEKERNIQLKLTNTQSIFAFESLQYAVLVFSLLHDHQEEENSNSEVDSNVNVNKSIGIDDMVLISSLLTSSPTFKAFRLKIKRRLLNITANKHLKNIASNIMQIKLEELFNEILIRYNYCLNPIRRIKINL